MNKTYNLHCKLESKEKVRSVLEAKLDEAILANPALASSRQHILLNANATIDMVQDIDFTIGELLVVCEGKYYEFGGTGGAWDHKCSIKC